MFIGPVFSYCYDTALLGESAAEQPDGDAEREQHNGQHEGDEAPGASFFARGRPGDAEGVDEQIEEEVEEFHSFATGFGCLMRCRPGVMREAD